tara:strand:+ start:970 stop:2691 length:1722 start_codon:yes stop_codon:yes gene_type:complete
MIDPILKIKSVDNSSVKKITEKFVVPNLIAKIMSLRGIENNSLSKKYFYPNIKNIHNPFLMFDMKKAVDRILNAKKNNEVLLIYGDYDVDGTTATALLFNFFKSLKMNVFYYIPNRENEGYGISKLGIDYAKSIGSKLFITCDCGMNDVEQISQLNQSQIDVIITDHHKQGERLPKSLAILNPNRKKCQYPFKGLCGAGVAFKFALAICKSGNFEKALIWKHVDLVALGIAADLVPISDENRIIAYYGLKQFIKGTNIGLNALKKTSKLNGNKITLGQLVFRIAPKINAAGRLGDAGRAVKLMSTNNPILAMDIAKKLEEENCKRQVITEKITNEAIYFVENKYDLKKNKAIILSNDGWHNGVIGIVASRIKELFFRPTILISLNNKSGNRASCRSIPGFNIVDGLDKVKNTLSNFGGHPMAAGFSIEKNNIQTFFNEFNKNANKAINNEIIKPILYIDTEIMFSDITNRLVSFLNYLEPYGPSNSRPLFITKNVEVIGIPKLIGKKQDVLKFTAKQSETEKECIGFNMANNYEKLIQNKLIDIVFTITENEWNQKKSIQLDIKNIEVRDKHV